MHTGVVREDGSGIAILTNDDLAEKKIEHSIVAIWSNDNWSEPLQLGWGAIGAAPIFDQDWLVVGAAGNYILLEGGRISREGQITSDSIPTYQIGILKRVKKIGGTVFVFGMCRQVYEFTSDAQWLPADDGVRRPLGDKSIVGFNAICGSSEGDIYGVGWKGEIWRRENRAWSQMDSPTNMILTAAWMSKESGVYIVGRRGLMLLGNDSQWQGLEHGRTSEDLWDVVEFDGKIYVSSMRSLFCLNNESLERVNFDIYTPTTFYHLSSAGPWLWTIGPKDLLAWDGRSWKVLAGD